MIEEKNEDLDVTSVIFSGIDNSVQITCRKSEKGNNNKETLDSLLHLKNAVQRRLVRTYKNCLKNK